jgi:hypothetical protein
MWIQVYRFTPNYYHQSQCNPRDDSTVGREETVGASHNSISTWLESTSNPLLEQSSLESADLYKHLYLPLATAPIFCCWKEFMTHWWCLVLAVLHSQEEYYVMAMYVILESENTAIRGLKCAR